MQPRRALTRAIVRVRAVYGDVTSSGNSRTDYENQRNRCYESQQNCQGVTPVEISFITLDYVTLGITVKVTIVPVDNAG